MIDDYKIKKTARQISEKVVDANGFDNSKPTHLAFLEGHIDGFNAGAKWAINELLKDLLHPASEVPRNDYTDILIVCKKPQHPIVLSLEDILDGAPDDIASYNDMWMHLCDVYKITKYCYIGDLLSKKGGENERA